MQAQMNVQLFARQSPNSGAAETVLGTQRMAGMLLCSGHKGCVAVLLLL